MSLTQYCFHSLPVHIKLIVVPIINILNIRGPPSDIWVGSWSFGEIHIFVEKIDEINKWSQGMVEILWSPGGDMRKIIIEPR